MIVILRQLGNAYTIGFLSSDRDEKHNFENDMNGMAVEYASMRSGVCIWRSDVTEHWNKE